MEQKPLWLCLLKMVSFIFQFQSTALQKVLKYKLVDLVFKYKLVNFHLSQCQLDIWGKNSYPNSYLINSIYRIRNYYFSYLNIET